MEISYSGAVSDTAFAITSDDAATMGDKFIIGPSGNVGINQTNPGAKLEVSGSVSITGIPGNITASGTISAGTMYSNSSTVMTSATSDAAYVNITGDTMTGNLTTTGLTSSGFVTATNKITSSTSVSAPVGVFNNVGVGIYPPGSGSALTVQGSVTISDTFPTLFLQGGNGAVSKILNIDEANGVFTFKTIQTTQRFLILQTKIIRLY
jgi:hypothetical protein